MSDHQPDLFPVPPPPLPAGLRFAEEFVTPAQAAELVGHIDDSPLAPFKFQGWEGKRLTASFGHSYDFDRGRLDEAPPLPSWLLPLREQVGALAGLDPERFVQALLNRYDPGAGIGWHRDRPQFGVVAGLSLGAQVLLRLRRRVAEGFERHALPLPPRSLYLLSGEVRHGWEHSIVPLDATRWSVTFRTLADHSGG